MLCLPLVSLLLLSVGHVSCQSGARMIPQWGVGLIAMMVFLFLVLVLYVGKKVLKKSSKSTIESVPAEESKAVPNGTFGQYKSRSDDHEHAYDNPIQVSDNILTTPM